MNGVLLRQSRTRTLLMLLMVGLLLVLTSAVQAQSSGVTDDDVNAIAKQMYCPVCENIPLDVCPTAACAQWREEIRTQLEAGRTPSEIIADFVQRFGERVVGTPQDPSLRALSLVTPWLIGVGALVIALVTLLRWRSNRRAAVAASGVGEVSSGGNVATDEEYRARIEHDLVARR